MYFIMAFLLAAILAVIGVAAATTDFAAGMVALGISALMVICGTIMEIKLRD